MVYIYYTIINSNISKTQWAKLVYQMPADIQQRIDRYRKEENKQQLVYGRLLLKQLLQDIGYVDFDLSNVQYKEHKKPFWREGIDFSIAHSGKVVACALSDQGAVGLDVERIRKIPVGDFKHILNHTDQEQLANSDTVYADFFKIWTIKEACSKADGRGLGMDVQQLFIKEKTAIFEAQEWLHFALELHEEYACHYVVEEAGETVVRLIDWE